MTSKRIVRTSHPALVSIDYTNSFAISYDEPVCGVCRSKMVIHRIESHNWSFACAMCRAEIDREVMNVVEGWERGEEGKEEAESKELFIEQELEEV